MAAALDDTKLSEVLTRAASDRERIVLTRDGKPWIAIVPVDDLAWLEAVEDGLDAAAFRDARAEWARSGGQTRSLDEVVRDLGIEA